MKKYLVLGTLAFAFAASPVLAEGGGGKHAKGGHHGTMMEKMFEKMDADGDGSITKAEFDTFHDQRFDEIDADKDGKVTKEEIKDHMEAKRQKWEEKKEMRKEGFGQGGPGSDDDGGDSSE